MRLKDYAERDGKRVWLSEKEVQLLLDHADDRGEITIAMQLMARAGLRRQEVVDVRFVDAVDTEGLVRLVRYRFDGTVDGEPVVVERTIRYEDVDSTSVEKPPWLDRAVGQ